MGAKERWLDYLKTKREYKIEINRSMARADRDVMSRALSKFPSLDKLLKSPKGRISKKEMKRRGLW